MRGQRSGVENLWTKQVKVDGVMQTVPSKRAGRGLQWRARFVDDQGREATKAFGRKVDAQQWVDQQTAARVTGTYIDPTTANATLADFYKVWSPDQVWETSTREAMDLAVNSVTFADVPFASLRPSHVQAWVKAMQTKGLQPGTIRTRFKNVRAVLRAAVRDRFLAHDVTASVKLPRQQRAAVEESDIPSPAEVGDALCAAKPDFVAFVALVAFAGLRPGEVAALKASDVDFLKRQIRVDRQVQYTASVPEFRPPKYGSKRTVYAPDQLLRLLSEHIRRHPSEEWLFPSPDGKPLRRPMVARRWGVIKDATGLDCRLHELRHFYASGLIHAGCDVVTVQRALGHASASVTLNYYASLWPGAEDRTRNAAAKLFDDAAYPLRTGVAE